MDHKFIGQPKLKAFKVVTHYQVRDERVIYASDEEDAQELAFEELDRELGHFNLVNAQAVPVVAG
jgi:hypothetical protein